LRDKARLTSIVALIFALGLVKAGIYRYKMWSDQSRSVFVNETADHYYDKSFKTSIRLAEKRSHVENALILLKESPPGQTIETAAVALFEKNHIGRRTGGKGLLFLYLEKEKQLKIEVSYALEGVFTDALCHRLEDGARTYMLSNQKREFITELIITMNIYYFQQSNGMKGEVLEFPYSPGTFGMTELLSGGGGVVGHGYASTMEQIDKETVKLPPTLARDYQPSGNAEETVDRYLASLKAGIGDRSLPLLTEGSRFFRAEVPKNAGQQQRVFDYFEKAKPYRIWTKGTAAVAVFKPGVPALPIVLRKDDKGRWLVDEAKSWAYFHLFEDDMDPRPKYDDYPFVDAWKEFHHPLAGRFIYYGKIKTPPMLDYPYSLVSKINALEDRIRNNPKDSNAYFELGDLLYFETYWLKGAMPLYEKGLELAPERVDYRWRLVDLYLNDTDIEKFIAELKTIKEMRPQDRDAKYYYDFYKKAYE
jgi:hypothetical protein